MSDQIIAVTPIYGWGWTIKGKPRFEVPAPFTLKPEGYGPPEWTGTVLDTDHEFAGHRVLLSQRHVEWDGYVVIEVEPKAVTDQLSSGFGKLAEMPSLEST